MEYSKEYQLSHITALFLESLLYGGYLYTCYQTALCLLLVPPDEHTRSSRWRTKKEISWTFIVAGVLLFLNSTLNIGLQLHRTLEVLVFLPAGLWSDSRIWSNVVKPAQVLIQSTIGDFVLVYRAYITYRRSIPVIILPLVLWIGVASCAIRGIEMQIVDGWSEEASRWYIAFWGLTVAFNVITTLLLIYRLRRVNDSIPLDYVEMKEQETKLHLITRFILESGLVYTIAAIVVLVCQAAQVKTAIKISTALEIVTVGIAFNLVLIRCSGLPFSYLGDDPDETQVVLSTLGPTDFPDFVYDGMRSV